MSRVAVYAGSLTVTWSAAVICVGILCCLTMTLALYRPRHRSAAPVWLLSAGGFVLGLFLGRLLHWYFNTELYGSLARAFTDFSVGSYVLPGILIGLWIAAALPGRLGLCDTGELLDCLAPGLCLLIGFVRLSAFFDSTCRSRILIEDPRWQRLPFAVAAVDAAGNVNWRFASFAMEAIAMAVILLLLLWFGLGRESRRRPGTGHVWRMFLLLFAAETVVIDSTRYDSPLMHFHILSSLNAYSSFISFAQIFAAVTALYVLLYYTVKSVRLRGLRPTEVLLWLLFAAAVFCAGYLGEYKVQRTNLYVRCYLIQSVSCLAMAVSGYLACRAWTRAAAFIDNHSPQHYNK